MIRIYCQIYLFVERKYFIIYFFIHKKGKVGAKVAQKRESQATVYCLLQSPAKSIPCRSRFIAADKQYFFPVLLLYCLQISDFSNILNLFYYTHLHKLRGELRASRSLQVARGTSRFALVASCARNFAFRAACKRLVRKVLRNSA